MTWASVKKIPGSAPDWIRLCMLPTTKFHSLLFSSRLFGYHGYRSFSYYLNIITMLMLSIRELELCCNILTPTTFALSDLPTWYRCSHRTRIGLYQVLLKVFLGCFLVHILKSIAHFQLRSPYHRHISYICNPSSQYIWLPMKFSLSGCSCHEGHLGTWVLHIHKWDAGSWLTAASDSQLADA